MNAANLTFRQTYPAAAAADFPTLRPELERALSGLGYRILTRQQPDASWAGGDATASAEALVALHDLEFATAMSAIERGAAWLWERGTGSNEEEISETDHFTILAALLHTGLAQQPERAELAAAAVQELRDIQAGDGGWFLESAGDAENLSFYDVGCAETTGRILEALGRAGARIGDETVERALEFLDGDQAADSGWAGRFGRDFLRGTWRVLAGLRSVGVDMQSIPVRRAVGWLKRVQHVGGGWGEATPQEEPGRIGAPNVIHTSWALLALIAADEWNSPEVESGVAWLLSEVEVEEALAALAVAAMALGRYRRACREHQIGNLG